MQVLPGAIKLGTQGTVGADAGTDVTLALQLSIDRLENIRTLLSVWDGNFTTSMPQFPHVPFASLFTRWLCRLHFCRRSCAFLVL